MECDYTSIFIIIPSTPHTETGKTPSELLFNRNINTRLNFVKPHVSQIMNEEGKRFTDFVNNSKTFMSVITCGSGIMVKIRPNG